MTPGGRQTLLTTSTFLEAWGAELARAQREGDLELELVLLPEDPDERLSEESRGRLELAWFSPDIFPARTRSFFSAVQGAPRLEWLHVFHAGVDNAVYQRLMARGVRLSTGAGASAEPIAQTAIAGLLHLARGFPHFLDAQRRRAWEPLPHAPEDLATQTLTVVGLGGIGSHIARLGRALGLHTIGIRRSPSGPDDPVDELHPPERLPELLPRSDWLALACPLTPMTRRLIDAEALSRLPRGARLLNVGRGELIDEPALIESLRKGHLAGAYLDVFVEEPLPATSPLWSLPNVLITPHASSSSRGNATRQTARFLENLVRFGRGETLLNEVVPES
jgi:D-2-hydroxyacid dehydrogenase (NADP+)